MSHNNENTMIDNHCEAFGDSSDKYTSLLNLLKRADEQSVRKLESITMKCRENVQQMNQQTLIDKYISRIWNEDLFFTCSMKLCCNYIDCYGDYEDYEGVSHCDYKRMNVVQFEQLILEYYDMFKSNPNEFIDEMCRYEIHEDDDFSSDEDELPRIEFVRDGKRYFRDQSCAKRTKKYIAEGCNLYLWIWITEISLEPIKSDKLKEPITPNTFKPNRLGKPSRKQTPPHIQTDTAHIECYFKRLDRDDKSGIYHDFCILTADEILADRMLIKRFMGIHHVDYQGHEIALHDLHNKRIDAVLEGEDIINIYKHHQKLKSRYDKNS